MAVAVSAIAALVSGATAVSVASVAEAVAAVGLDLSVAGAVTGSKALTKIGGVMAVGGGVTDLASSGIDALFNGAATPADTASASTGASQATSDTSLTPGAAVTPDASVTAAPSAGVQSTPTGMINMPTNDAFSGIPTANPADPLSIGVPPGSPTDIANSAIQASQGPFPGASLSGDILSPSAATQQLGNVLNQGADATKNWFQALSPVAQYGIVQAVGQGLGGLSGMYTAQQKLSLDQLINSENWQKYTTAYGNVNAPATVSWGGQPSPAVQAPKVQNLLTPNPTNPQVQPVVETTGLISTPGA